MTSIPRSTLRPVRSLRDLTRERLKAIRKRQQDLARALGISPPYLSGLLSGKRPINLDNGLPELWCVALGVTGPEAEMFLDAIHLAAASPRVRALLTRHENDAQRGRALKARYTDRIRMIRFIMDHIELREDNAHVLPSHDVDLGALVRLIEDLARTAARSVTMPKPTEPPPDPAA